MDQDLSLAADLVARRLVGKLLNELVGLYVDILSSLERLGGSDISSEEFLGSGGSCLGLRSGLLLFVIEDLLILHTGWGDVGGIIGASVNSPIIHDVLRVVFSVRKKG